MWKFNPVFFLSILVTFLLPLLLLVTLYAGIFYNSYYLTTFSIHLIIEFILYFVGIRQFDKQIQVLDFAFWFIIHIPYIVCMGIGSFFANQLSWKGR